MAKKEVIDWKKVREEINVNIDFSCGIVANEFGTIDILLKDLKLGEISETKFKENLKNREIIFRITFEKLMTLLFNDLPTKLEENNKLRKKE